MEHPPKVGREIQRLRLLNNITLDELARKSGVSKSILSQIERDLSNPTLATIWRITKALESSLDDVFFSNEGVSSLDLEYRENYQTGNLSLFFEFNPTSCPKSKYPPKSKGMQLIRRHNLIYSLR